MKNPISEDLEVGYADFSWFIRLDEDSYFQCDRKREIICKSWRDFLEEKCGAPLHIYSDSTKELPPVVVDQFELRITGAKAHIFDCAVFGTTKVVP